MERQGNELVFRYIDARIASDAAERAASLAQFEASKAREAMQDAWRDCKFNCPTKGVYSFKEHGRTCVVIGDGDYPALTQIVQ